MEIDADGLSMSDSVDTWDCYMLVKINMLQDVPSQHQEVLVEAFTKVLQRIKEDKWLCFLPQACLRESSRARRQSWEGADSLKV